MVDIWWGKEKKKWLEHFKLLDCPLRQLLCTIDEKFGSRRILKNEEQVFPGKTTT